MHGKDFQVEESAGTIVVPLRGELDAHDAPGLKNAFTEAIASLACLGDGARLVVDLTAVTFLDSTVLGTLVGALRRVRESGGELLVVLPETPARRIFEITGLDQVLNVRSTRAEALSG